MMGVGFYTLIRTTLKIGSVVCQLGHKIVVELSAIILSQVCVCLGSGPAVSVGL